MYKIFSVDDHIVEPPTSGPIGCRRSTATSPTWSRRTGESSGCTRTSGSSPWALNAVAGKPREEWNMEPASLRPT